MNNKVQAESCWYPGVGKSSPGDLGHMKCKGTRKYIVIRFYWWITEVGLKHVVWRCGQHHKLVVVKRRKCMLQKKKGRGQADLVTPKTLIIMSYH